MVVVVMRLITANMMLQQSAMTQTMMRYIDHDGVDDYDDDQKDDVDDVDSGGGDDDGNEDDDHDGDDDSDDDSFRWRRR